VVYIDFDETIQHLRQQYSIYTGKDIQRFLDHPSTRPPRSLSSDQERRRFQLCVCHLSFISLLLLALLKRPAALRTTFCSSNARLVLTPRRDASIPSCSRRRLRSTSTSLVCVATPWRKVRLLHLLASLYYYTGKVRRIRWRRSHCMVSFYRFGSLSWESFWFWKSHLNVESIYQYNKKIKTATTIGTLIIILHYGLTIWLCFLHCVVGEIYMIGFPMKLPVEPKSVLRDTHSTYIGVVYDYRCV